MTKYYAEIKNGKVFVIPDTKKEKEESKTNNEEWQDDTLTEYDYEKFAEDDNAVISRLQKIEKKLEEMSGADNDEMEEVMQSLNSIDYQGNGGVTSIPDNNDHFNAKSLKKK